MKNARLKLTDTGGNKPAILFVHGIMMNRHVWDGQIHAFSDSHRVVAVDLRGFGESQLSQPPLATVEHAADLNELVRELELVEPTLVGWSFGGGVALISAAREPEIYARLVLVSTTPKLIQGDDFPDALPVEAAQQLGGALASDFSAGCRAFARMIVSEAQMKEVEDQLFEMAAASDPGTCLATLGAVSIEDLRPYLSQVRTPTSVIWGSRDQVCLPSANRYIVQHIQGANGVELPELGHAPMLTDPKAFDSALRQVLGK
jgi:sigma-B regulation protein RsbQ